jgi:hypothetical protein
MMGTTLRNIRIACVTLLIAGAAIASPRALAQNPPADPSPQADAQNNRNERKNLSDPELRKRFRDMLAKRLDNRRRELDNLDKALKMFDEGKTYDDIRSLLPDMPHPGSRSEWREQGLRRWEEGGSGGPSDGTPGAGPGPGPRSSEPQRPLTDDERKTVREILKEIAPKTLERLQDLEKSKPEEAEKQYSEAFRRSRWLLETRKRDPELFDLQLKEIGYRRQALEASAAIVKLDAPPEPGVAPLSDDKKNAERKSRTDQLRQAVKDQYEVRTRIMRKEADARPAQQAAAVDKAVNDMLDRAKRGHGNRGEGNRGGGGDGERRPPPGGNAAEPDDGQAPPPKRK